MYDILLLLLVIACSTLRPLSTGNAHSALARRASRSSLGGTHVLQVCVHPSSRWEQRLIAVQASAH